MKPKLFYQNDNLFTKIFYEMFKDMQMQNIGQVTSLIKIV